MTKSEEILNPLSCFNKAHDNESLFVLLARDKAAPIAIRAWIDARVALGLNQPDDPQLLEAEARAKLMEEERTRKPGVRS